MQVKDLKKMKGESVKLRKSLKGLLIVGLALMMVVAFMGCGETEDPNGNGEEPDESAIADYPTQPLQVIIPQAAGGAFDLTGRAISGVASEHYGQPMSIELRPGGGTVVGTQEVINSTPDGYTLAGMGEHAVALRHFEDIPINVLEDLEPIANVGQWQWVLAVPGDDSPDPSPFHTFEEFMEHAVENPGDIDLANCAPRTLAHMPGLQLEAMSDAEFTHVPYDGGGPARMAMQSAEVDAGIGVDIWVNIDAQEDKLRPLAITGTERHPDMPDVPTFEELGYDIHTVLSWGLFAPKDTPEEIIDYLEEKTKELTESDSFLNIMDQMDDEPHFLNREEFRSYLEEADKNFEEVVKELEE